MKKKLQKLWQWLNRPHFIIIQTPAVKFKSGYTKDEKIAILTQHLTQGYEDYDKTTNKVEIHPAIKAEQDVKQMDKDGLIDYYFELLLLNRKHNSEFQALNQKYGR